MQSAGLGMVPGLSVPCGARGVRERASVSRPRRAQALEARVEARGVSLKDVAAIDTTTEWVYGRSPTKTQADTRAVSGDLWSVSSLSTSSMH